tara:strand:+ start:1785 stop:2480 length:696 start_codon:yes stop_codon:yes gene_type:complete
MEHTIETFFNLNNTEHYKSKFIISKKVQIKDILIDKVADLLFKQAIIEKNWILATGFDNMKFEKRISKQFEKANSIQIKKIQDKFKNNHFSYIFHRTMNNQKPSFLEYTLRKNMASNEFIDYLNKITNLGLSKLNTLFLSKYKGGNFLSPHSDQGNGKLAFVLNLTKNWKPQYGGILHFMNEEKTEIIESYIPLFNNLMLFEVPEGGIPHFVSHVVPYIKQDRYSITGWYI